jgi:hypothetical protein
MPRQAQGVIFAAVNERRADLAIIFGHVGFNEMRQRWRAFVASIANLSHVRDPFSELPGAPLRSPNGVWLWFVPEQQNHGMAEPTLTSALDAALAWAKSAGIRSIITNGIADTDHGHDTAANRTSDDKRARFLVAYTTEQERVAGFSIELISLNDVFIRNGTPVDSFAAGGVM